MQIPSPQEKKIRRARAALRRQVHRVREGDKGGLQERCSNLKILDFKNRFLNFKKEL